MAEQGTAISAQTGTDNSYVLPPYGALDLAADLTRGNWMIRLFARNVTDRPAYIGGGLGVDADNVPYGIDASVLQPRTVGISVDVGFWAAVEGTRTGTIKKFVRIGLLGRLTVTTTKGRPP